MAGHDIIVVGASAGGVEPLIRLVEDLPRDLAASVFIVLHMSAHGNTALPQILARRAAVAVGPAVDGAEIERGRVYVAVPDRHLFLEPGVVKVVAGPKENGHRPSIDGLFRTAAAAYGPRVVGVVLSGSRDDGTVGLRTIRRHGGRGVIQDPEEAPFPGMPQSALDFSPRRCCPRKPPRSRRRCGPPTGCSRSAPRSAGGWRIGPKAAGRA